MNSFRSLRRAPLYALTSILTLAIGIASVTAVFSLVDAVLIKPLPFADASRLMVMAQSSPGGNQTGVSYPNFVDWQSSANRGVIESMAYARGRATTIRSADGPAPMIVALVSPGFFHTLGQRAEMGRTFTADEDRDGAHVIVLSWESWQARFAGDPAVVGKTAALQDGSYAVIGVLPRGVVVPQWAQGYVPLRSALAVDHTLAERGNVADNQSFARLAPGVPVARATAELTATAQRLAEVYPDDKVWPAAQLQPLRDAVLGNAGTQVAMLFGAVALVLLIGWVNVANLAIVRAASRTREVAIRIGLGASRAQIAWTLLGESLAIASCAVVAGGILAAWAVALVRSLASGIVPRADTIGLDLSALAVAIALGVVSAIAIGVVPAMRGSHASLIDALREGSNGAGISPKQQRLRAGMVVGEIAFAMALVIAAGLLIRSFSALARVNPGFNPHQLVAVDISPPRGRYDDPAQAALFYGRLQAAAALVPGVASAALSNHLPLNGAAMTTQIEVPGHVADGATDRSVLFRTLSPEYIGTMQIPLHRGRNFSAADMSGGSAVLVNETLARTYWPGVDPIGRSVTLHKSAQGRPDFGEAMPGVVVGVIGDVHHFGVATPPYPEVYVPYTRNPWSHMVVIARSTGDASRLIPALRRALTGVDADVVTTGGPLNGFAVVDDILTGGVAGERLNMGLLSAFGLTALLLSALGVYGLTAYTVAERNREIGVRLALGAQRSDVMRMILGTGGRLVAIGAVLGIGGALALTRLLSSLLFGVTATDPLTFAAMTAVLVTVALAACAVPAWRASRVDPVGALRS